MAFASSVAIFLGSFLLFLMQPVIGKMILPWFGGTSAVWTTCMLFFQVLLLAGYAYAALLTRIVNPIRQATIHIALLAAALMLLPITPNAAWKPPDGENPAMRILLLLTVTVGFPYFLLSATSPIVQAWFARGYPGRSPYRLYALSNVGSLGALLAYPFVVEPWLTTTQQGLLWSISFVVFVVGYGVLGWQLWQMRATLMQTERSQAIQVAAEKLPRKGSFILSAEPSRYDRWLWLWLSALASMMLLSVTNHLCQDVAVVPFLWIVPLALYLLSLIICFDRDWWYSRRWFSLSAMIAILVASDLAFLAFLDNMRESSGSGQLWRILRYDIRVVIGVYLTLFFLICMVCHGEVVRRRPRAERLTEFYLTVAAGGALGGIIIAVVCPLVFTSFVELKIGLLASFIVCLSVFLTDLNQRGLSSPKPVKPKKTTSKPENTLPKVLVGVISILMVAAVAGAQWVSLDQGGAKITARNFYGSLKVREWFDDDPEHYGQAMYHGAILHGYQYLNGDKERLPTTYYSEKSGVGRAMSALRTSQPLRVGVVGLGAGTLAAYSQAGDTFRFYEINPLVIALARSPFTFLSHSPANIDVISGDARISLEREESQQFDILVLDAFSGDSIPVHLLTREAMEVYLRHLKPDGLIAIHVSNRYVDLFPVVDRLAAANQLNQLAISQDEYANLELSPSQWILLAPTQKTLDRPGLRNFGKEPKSQPNFPLWTDEYNNLFQLLRQIN
jgi:SAM-dependent methyltransferase